MMCTDPDVLYVISQLWIIWRGGSAWERTFLYIVIRAWIILYKTDPQAPKAAMFSLLNTFWNGDFQELKSLSQFLTEVVPTPTVPRCSSSAADRRGRWRMGGFTKNVEKKKKAASWFGPRVLNDARKLLAMQQHKGFYWLTCSGPSKVLGSIGTVDLFTFYFKYHSK